MHAHNEYNQRVIISKIDTCINNTHGLIGYNNYAGVLQLWKAHVVRARILLS